MPAAIIEILPGPAAKADVVADGAQDAHHLLVEVARVHLIAVGFVMCIKLRNV